MLQRIAIAVGGVIAAILLYAAVQPNEFRVERSAAIKAPPERLFALIDDLHRWGAWSPWEKIDAGMKRTHSGAAHGVGAIYEWEGNAEVGAGRMEILEAAPPSRVRIKLDFLKPFEGHNTAEFTLEPQGESTKVTWAMWGPNSFLGKVIGVFMSMDKMIGGQFEQGLVNMRAAAGG